MKLSAMVSQTVLGPEIRLLSFVTPSYMSVYGILSPEKDLTFMENSFMTA